MGGRRTPTYIFEILATVTDPSALVRLGLLLLAVVLALADRLVVARVVVRERRLGIGLVHVAEQVALVVEDVAARATVNGTGAVRGVGGHGVLLSDTTFITHDASQTRMLARSDVQLLQRLREPLLGVGTGRIPVVHHYVGGAPQPLRDALPRWADQQQRLVQQQRRAKLGRHLHVEFLAANGEEDLRVEEFGQHLAAEAVAVVLPGPITFAGHAASRPSGCRPPVASA